MTDSERDTLKRWGRGRSTSARQVLLARIILPAVAGRENRQIAVELGTGEAVVSRVWRAKGLKPHLIETF